MYTTVFESANALGVNEVIAVHNSSKWKLTKCTSRLLEHSWQRGNQVHIQTTKMERLLSIRGNLHKVPGGNFILCT